MVDNPVNLLLLLRETGILRFALFDDNLPETYTKDDKKIYRTLACINSSNKTVENEKLHIAGTVDMINSRTKPNVPMLMFISDGSGGTGMDKDIWRKYQRDYASELTEVSIIELDCGHMIHHFKPEQISEDMREFIERLDD